MDFDVAVAVSGGVDSLYALTSLHDSGLRVCAVHALFCEPKSGDSPIPLLQENCKKMEVPLFVLDLREQFQKNVVDPFCTAYMQGKTPNPCAWCNRLIKFGLLRDAAIEHGAATIATGHYVRLVNHPAYGTVIGAANDTRKDQSYFLALVPKEKVITALFPLGTVSKPEARAYVTKAGLRVPLPKESQDICFVPDNDYRTVLQNNIAELPEGGDIEVRHRVVGHHAGLWRYTEGQRRGLGIAWGEPLYVIRKDVKRNVLVVGTADEVTQTECFADHANYFVSHDLWKGKLFVRLRYKQQAMAATVITNGTKFQCIFEKPEQKVAPGQIAAVYDEDGILLAGGVLVEE